MNNFLHTLTAYHLEFSYMKRNNPLREELLEEIKNDETPKVAILELLNEFVTRTKNRNYFLLLNNGKIILLDKIENVCNIDSNNTRIFIAPKAGKTDIPIQMVNLKDIDKVYNFSSDWASTYSHNIFIYHIEGEYYMVCHRTGGSGCKTILCSVLNKLLKAKGIKIDMNWMPPVNDASSANYDIDKITLIYEENRSSDIADDPIKKQKKVPIKELTLSLKTGHFKGINHLLHRCRLKEISKEETFSGIKAEIDDDEYNNASLMVKFGKVKKKVAWDEIERLIDGFDITEKVSGLKGNEFINELMNCADSFIHSLIHGG